MKIKDKVLIVEDEQSISNFISMILTANGFDTIIVRTGEEALTMIASHCPDMIVLDLGLPDMDGMEVLKSVRKWSNLPVVVVSARNHEHDKVEALDYGADDYLVKPFSFSELVARILLTALPWYLAGLTLYLLTAWICLEPTWKRRLANLLIAVGVCRIFFLSDTPQAYDGMLPWLALLLVCSLFFPLLSVYRFKQGCQD